MSKEIDIRQKETVKPKPDSSKEQRSDVGNTSGEIVLFPKVSDEFKNLSAMEVSGKNKEEWYKDLTAGRSRLEPNVAKGVMRDQMANAKGWLVGNKELRKKVPLT